MGCRDGCPCGERKEPSLAADLLICLVFISAGIVIGTLVVGALH